MACVKLVSWRQELYFHPLSCWLLSLPSTGTPIPLKLSLSPLPDAKDLHGCKFKNTLNKGRKKRKIEVLLEWKSEGWHYALMRSPTIRLKANDVACSNWEMVPFFWITPLQLNGVHSGSSASIAATPGCNAISLKGPIVCSDGGKQK